MKSYYCPECQRNEKVKNGSAVPVCYCGLFKSGYIIKMKLKKEK